MDVCPSGAPPPPASLRPTRSPAFPATGRSVRKTPARHLQQPTSRSATQEQSVPVVQPKALRLARRLRHRAVLGLLLALVGAAGPALATTMQPLESIAEAAIAALGAGDAQSAEAVL